MSNEKKAVLTGKQKDIAGLVLRCLIVFLVPFITGVIIFKKKQISPFGDQDLLSIDLWGQYFPMYRKFATDHGFSEAMYNWSGALGFNNWVQNAFYTRSLFLIPFTFVSLENSITYVDTVCLLRFGLGAVACQLFLEYKFKSKSPLIMAVSIGYGLCAYSTAFIMQFMWTDGLFLAPLVLLGLERLIRGKSPLMYVLMLALTIYTNFYTGFGVCLFTGFYFLSELFKMNFTGKDGKRLRGLADFKARGILFGRFSLYSVIGGVLTAFMLLPTVKGLSHAESANEGVLNFSQWYHTLAENVACMLPETPASLEFGVANIAVGLFAFILIPLFFMNKEITFSEKIFSGAFVAVLYAGLNYNPMDWVFNGFHFPNQLPGRWSFLFSFAIVIICANGIAKRKGITLAGVISSLLIGMFFVGFAKYGNLTPERTENLGHWNVLLCVFAAAMAVCTGFSGLSEYAEKKAKKAEEDHEKALAEAKSEGRDVSAIPPVSDTNKKKAFAFRACAFGMSCVLAVMAAGEACRDTYNVAAKEGAGIPVSGMDSYIKVTDVLLTYGQKYTNGNDDFYRMEANDGWTFNTSMLGDFNGIGYYGSTLNYGVYQLMRDMGNRVYANNVSTVYNCTSLFQNSLFGIKYVIDRGKYFGARTGKGYNMVEDAENCYIWENPTAFPLAFGASNKILDMNIDPTEIRPITTQNDMLNKLWGQDINVFEHIDPNNFTFENSEFAQSANWNDNYYYRTDDTQPVKFVWTYIVQDDEPLYMEQNFRAGTLIINGTDNVDIGAEKFRCLGSFPAGTEITIEYTVNDVNIGCFGLDVYKFNMNKWGEVYNRVSSEGLKVTSFKNTDVKGTISVPASQMILTTIPQDGGWTVYVDGKKTQDFTALGALMAFTVDAGEHDIEFKYHVPAFGAGIAISLFALAMLAACWFVWYKGGLSKVFAKNQAEPVPAGNTDAKADVTAEEKTEAPKADAKDKKADKKSENGRKHKNNKKK